MKIEVTKSDFIGFFKSHDRDDFSYEALCALYDYIISYEEDCDTDITLDVIALCCEYSEYENFEEIRASYEDIETLEDLTDNTTVIEFETGIIIQNF